MRICRLCQQELPIDLFDGGRRWQCNECRLKKRLTSERYNKNVVHRRWKLKKYYGITEADYEQMLSDQDGVCAICKQSDPNKALSVDHNHQTGEVRKLLCSSCNFAIAHAKEDPEILRACIAYLESFEEVPKP